MPVQHNPTGARVAGSVMPESDVFTSTGDRPGPAALPVAASATSGQPTGHGAATDVRQDGRIVAASVADGWPRHWPRAQYPDTATIAAVRAWLVREVEAGYAAATVEVPLFGTAAWVALPDSEPAKWVALVRAARAWFADYVAIPDTTAAQLREERERFEAWADERDRADGQLFRRFAMETADMVERRQRRERDAARTVLPDRSGPELVAAARASFAWLDGPSDAAAGAFPDSAEVA